MTEEQYFSRLTAHYERFEDYDDEEWIYLRPADAVG